MYFCGWQRLRQLENGIMVWEKLNVPPLSTILPKEDVPTFQKLMWGLIPLATVLLAFMINIQLIWVHALKSGRKTFPVYFKYGVQYTEFKKSVFKISYLWGFLMLIVTGYGIYWIYIKNEKQINPVRVTESYYDALDFKEFERAYSYLDPESNKTIDQYMLEIAVTDGLLSSYAKLDRIKVNITAQTDRTAKVKVLTHWITPLEKIDKTFYHELVKYGKKWFVKPLEYDLDIPPDQLFAENITAFYNHGRRRISSEQTYHEDVLKQPVLEVLSTRIVEFENQYSLIGEIQNIDNIPADVVITGTLYNDKDEKLARYNAKHQMKHKLMPKEITSFRINFEGIAWVDKEDHKPETFDPDEFTPVEFDEKPTKFDLQSAGNVTTVDLYKGVAINELSVKNDVIEGVLFNSGLEEVTIPLLLISYYDENYELIWVDHQYLPEGIRPQRKQYFGYQFLDLSCVTIINKDMKNVFVNGLLNTEISSKVVPERKAEHQSFPFLSIQGKGFSYIKLEINPYIGMPN